MDGMVRIDCPSAVNGYIIKIRFKRWGKLWSPGNLNLYSLKRAQEVEQRDYRIGSLLYQLPVPAPLKRIITGKRYSLKKRAARRKTYGGDVPTCLMIECFNPAKQPILLSLTIRSASEQEKIPFQKLIILEPGFQAVQIPFREICEVVDVRSAFHIELIPNETTEEEVTLYFGLMDFVREQESVPKRENKGKIKCVVWDLDNTLWDGVLVEDGPDHLRLKSDIVAVVETLDQRGILQSIASKNNYDEAMQVLQKFGIAEYFLYPQITWSPKSEGINAISKELNIGIDTLLFVDDSAFELQEVQSRCAGMQVLDAKDYALLPDMDQCKVLVTQESKSRRKMYQVERVRKETGESFKDDYRTFLKHCNLRLTIQPLTEENLERVHELTQRTNQMNFSGNRYDRAVLRGIVTTSFLDTFVLSCEDRFGSYGIVGFGLIDNREPRMTDLMFSCRIQSKRVEHAYLAYVIKKYRVTTGKDFLANYRKTPRNAVAGRVFSDLGMEEMGTLDGVTSLVFFAEKHVPDDGIIETVVQERANAGELT